MDDLLATGGTLRAAIKLCNLIEGSQVAASYVLFEIIPLGGREKIEKDGNQVVSIVELGQPEEEDSSEPEEDPDGGVLNFWDFYLRELIADN